MTDHLRAADPQIFDSIVAEAKRQGDGLELIASENFVSRAVMEAMGTVFTNKYAEGLPGKRYYGGCEFVDVAEQLAIDRAKALFGAEHANVQPLSGSPMNKAVYLAFLEPGDTVLAMDLSHGGHLTHGDPVSHMGRLFNFVRYKTRPGEAGRVDFDELMKLARLSKPRIVLCGTTSSPRVDDYAAYRRVAEEVGALAMADVSHVGGLIAGGALENPFDHGFDVVTTTTHKSLRGPRGGLVLCRKELAKAVDRSVFPGLQGGPHMNAIAAMAVALRKAAEPGFREYAAQVISNAAELATSLIDAGAALVTGGPTTI